MTVLVVTGTDTGVGKTVATAALACHARLAGFDVAVCKPVQTGAADGDDDLAEVTRLSGVNELVSGWRYPEPLAPVAAAERAGMPLPTARSRSVTPSARWTHPAGSPSSRGQAACWSNSARTG